MVLAEPACYTLLSNGRNKRMCSEMHLKQDLENGSIKIKTEAMQQIIKLTMAGHKMPGLLMPIIQFVLPQDDHYLKKLLLIYWEMVPKTTPDGKLLKEMIMVCNYFLKDLNHPNEYVRGTTLRYLCKLKEKELLEPLIEAVKSCLKHTHSYVRENAVLALGTIYKNFQYLIPDAPVLITSYLEREDDTSCRRNAFLMLVQIDHQKALKHLESCVDEVETLGESLQLTIIELIYKVCSANPAERSKFVSCIYNLMKSTSAAVRYEAAGILVTLADASSAMKAAVLCYVDLIIKESDNNVKLVVLDRLVALKKVKGASSVLRGLAMDILRVLAVQDLNVRTKTLNFAVELASSQNVGEMLMLLKNELARKQNTPVHQEMKLYTHHLIKTIHKCLMKFPDEVTSVISVLMEFLSDQDERAVTDVLIFIREVVRTFTKLRPLVVQKLLESFPSIQSAKVHSNVLWTLAELAETPQEIIEVMQEVRKALGKIPLVDDDDKETPTKDPRATKERNLPPFRKYMLDGNFRIGVAIAVSLVKLAFKFESPNVDPNRVNSFFAEAMLIIASIFRLGNSVFTAKKMNIDQTSIIQSCLRTLSDRSPKNVNAFIANSKQAAYMLFDEKEGAKEAKSQGQEFDDTLTFTIFESKTNGTPEDIFEASLNQAVTDGKTDGGIGVIKVLEATQLTGQSEAVYAEAIVNANQFNSVVLDVLMMNRTCDTLQKCALELHTIGHLELVKEPSPVNLAPYDVIRLQATIKVKSTDKALIFGSIAYEVNGAEHVIELNSIDVDVTNYVVPATCTDEEFRKMWEEFDWENKLAVNTKLTDLEEYLDHVVKFTNMRCLTPKNKLVSASGVLGASLYAKSNFGEDILAHLCIARRPGSEDTPITGDIRIRTNSQGMAVSFGDKMKFSSLMQLVKE